MDLLYGPLWDKILGFSIPLMASNILQQLFNSADSAVIGKFVGSNALAAAGSSASFINMLITLFLGLSVGVNIIISDSPRRQNWQHIQKMIHTSSAFASTPGSLFQRLLLSVNSNLVDMSS